MTEEMWPSAVFEKGWKPSIFFLPKLVADGETLYAADDHRNDGKRPVRQLCLFCCVHDFSPRVIPFEREIGT
jgi:hypothetical protein